MRPAPLCDQKWYGSVINKHRAAASKFLSISQVKREMSLLVDIPLEFKIKMNLLFTPSKV